MCTLWPIPVLWGSSVRRSEPRAKRANRLMANCCLEWATSRCFRKLWTKPSQYGVILARYCTRSYRSQWTLKTPKVNGSAVLLIVTIISQALQLYPGNSKALWRLTRSLMLLEQWELAGECIELFKKRFPNDKSIGRLSEQVCFLYKSVRVILYCTGRLLNFGPYV